MRGQKISAVDMTQSGITQFEVPETIIVGEEIVIPCDAELYDNSMYIDSRWCGCIAARTNQGGQDKIVFDGLGKQIGMDIVGGGKLNLGKMEDSPLVITVKLFANPSLFCGSWNWDVFDL